MEITDYILSIIEVNPAVTVIYTSQYASQYIVREQLPPSVSVVTWQEDWCEGRAADGSVVVRFRP